MDIFEIDHQLRAWIMVKLPHEPRLLDANELSSSHISQLCHPQRVGHAIRQDFRRIDKETIEVALVLLVLVPKSHEHKRKPQSILCFVEYPCPEM